MAKTIGRAFKIAKKDVKSYGYATPNRGSRGRMTPNAGVTAVAAVNGPGSYARHHQPRSARAAMSGLSRNARLDRARQITGADRAAFARRMSAAKKAKGSMRTNASKSQIDAARRNIRKAIAARSGGTHAANKRRAPRRAARKAVRKTAAHRPNAWPLESQRHAQAALRGHGYSTKSTAGTAAKRRAAASKKKHKANKRKPMRTHRRNTSAKRRATALRNLRKAHRANATTRTRTRKRRAAPKRALRANKRRVVRKTHRRNRTAKQRAAALKNLRKARLARNGSKRRVVRKHRRNAKRRVARKSMRRNAKRRTVRKSLARNGSKRRVVRKHRRNAKRRVARKSMRRNRTAKQRAAALRNLRKARLAKNGRRVTRRKKHRRNAKRRTVRRTHRRNGMMSNRRRRTSRKAHLPNKRRAKRRTHRRNGLMSNRRSRKAFRKNAFMATLTEVMKTGAMVTLGFGGHKIATKFVTDLVIDRLFGSSGVATPAAPAAVSGLEMLQPYRSVIGGTAVALAGVYLANKTIKDARVKVLLTAGMATSLLHSVAVVALSKVAPAYVGYLSGHDGTAASISAMYGFGAGASIMPEYHPIGEYFAQNGLGEYFAQNGLGAYTSNPDLMQAAAGYGTVENHNSNIIDPGGDLDAQLSIAEAAAGVGAAPYEAAAGFGRVQPFEASAGIGEYFAQNGFGAINTVQPTADTWIPGTSDGQLWAGTRAISRGQSANEMTSAGILETEGNQGVFG